MVQLMLQYFKKQMSYVQYSDRTLLGINKVEIIQELFTLSKVDNSHADRVEKNIKNSLEKNLKFNTLSSRIK